MPHIDSHAPGAFSWVELATTDQAAAKTFYSRLFGWAVDDSPVGPGETYSMFTLEGRHTGAAYTMREDERQMGIPSHWNLYVTVRSADAVAGRVAGLGGKVLVPPFDVMDVGRMAVIQDPTGAVLALWEARKHIGTGIAGVPNTLCWADLNTPDRDRVEPFYTGLFGWTFGKEDADPAHAYWHIKNGEEYIGGLPPAAHQQPGVPPHWLVYFEVASCDASAEQAKQLGARWYLPPTSFEHVGRMAVIADPQGAVFALFEPERKN
jgi:predicted enzyme related to lactoylglutathione lyase